MNSTYDDPFFMTPYPFLEVGSSYNDPALTTSYSFPDAETVPWSQSSNFNFSEFPQSEVAAPTPTVTDVTFETCAHQPPTVEDLESTFAPKRRRQRNVDRKMRVRATVIPGVATPPLRHLCRFGCTGRNSLTYLHANTLWRHYLDKHVPEAGHQRHLSDVNCHISGCSFVGRRYRTEKFTNHFRVSHPQDFDHLKASMRPNSVIHKQTKDELERNLIEFLLHHPPSNSPPHAGPFLTYQDIGLEGKRSIMTEDEQLYEKKKAIAKANLVIPKREKRPREIPPRRQAIPTTDPWIRQHTDRRASGLIHSAQPNMSDTAVGGNVESHVSYRSDLDEGFHNSFEYVLDFTPDRDDFTPTDCPKNDVRGVFNDSHADVYAKGQIWSPCTLQYPLSVPEISDAEIEFWGQNPDILNH